MKSTGLCLVTLIWVVRECDERDNKNRGSDEVIITTINYSVTMKTKVTLTLDTSIARILRAQLRGDKVRI